MLRFYLRPLLVLIALFTAVLLMIRAQPYDDHELRELLLPEGCPAPCFMGIRPGVTTIDEAIEMLEKSGRIKIVAHDPISDRDTSTLRLAWNRSQLKFIDVDFPLVLVFQNTEPKIITLVAFRPQKTVTLGDFYLLLGKPSRFNRNIFLTPSMGYDRYYLEVSHIYDDEMIKLSTSMGCPISLNQLLHQFLVQFDYNATIRANRQLDFKTILNYPDCG
ncbi:MAG: hypothetical protein GC179_12520 [Anaerolineaceae bacterium]|nr:hypothetical protein [Anaerolineaceae bacterium]